LPDDAMVMFTNEGLALSWWVDEVHEYALRLAGEDKWREYDPKLHLYWKTKPAFHSADYLAMDQGQLLRTQSPLGGILQITLGFVQSEMLISKLGPDGKEG